MSYHDKLSAAIITKGEPTLKRAIDSVVQWVSEVVVLNTSGAFLDLGDYANVRVIDWAWQRDFGLARRTLELEVRTPYYIWIDSDDQLVVPDASKFETWLKEITDTPNTIGTMVYNYSFDEKGRPAEVQVRERILPVGYGEWAPRIHEIWNFRKAVKATLAPDGVVMKHDMVQDQEKARAKAERNVAYMEEMLKAEGPDSMDLRVVAHLAEGYKILGQVARALKILQHFARVETGGWPKSRVFLSMADCALLLENRQLAKQYAACALAEEACNLGAVRFLLDLCIQDEDFEGAMFWFKIGYESNLPLSGDLVHCQARIFAPPFGQVALMMAHMGKVRAGMEYARKSGDKALIAELEDIIATDNRREAALEMVRLMKDDGARAAFVRALPSNIQASPGLVEFVLPAMVPGVLNIGIFAPGDIEWSPGDIDTKGLGGSETAVVKLARSMVEQGAQVEVYGPFPDMISDAGVLYMDQALYNPSRPLDVFIAWRSPTATAYAPEKAYKVVWLHDAINPHDWDLAEEPDEIWCLSDYHAKVAVPARLQSKVYRTENGIDADLADLRRRIPKVSGRVIYASSPDRGLDNLLDWWPEIKLRVPHAELHVFYGFNAYWMEREKSEPEMRTKRLALEKALAETPGVVYRGKVSQKELHAEMARAIVWAYPTEFNEISCIVGKECQVLGAYPVVSRYAALNETVLVGTRLGAADRPDIKDHRERFVNAVVEVLQNPPRAFGMDFTIPTWDDVAKDLLNHLEDRVNDADRSTEPGLIAPEAPSAPDAGGSEGTAGVPEADPYRFTVRPDGPRS